jgi:hypothetical protein
MGSDYRGDIAADVAILFLVLAWTAVALRIYVRAFMTKSWGIDDWFGVASLVCYYKK